MKLILFLSFFLLTACQTPVVNNQSWVKTCGTISAGIEYCIYDTAPDIQQKPTVFFMHGLGDSKDVFTSPTSVPSSYPELIAKFPAARIVVVSWGKGWLLTGYGKRTQKPLDATLETFHDIVIPYLVSHHPIGAGPYKLVGHSMGGFNVAQLCSRYPSDWSSCTLINPMMIKDSQDPWNLLSICPACIDLKYNFDSKAQWLSDRPSPSPTHPPTFVTACQSDIFQLYDGGKEYALKAHAQFIDGVPGCTHWLFDVPWVIRSLK
jgi:predicted esterase